MMKDNNQQNEQPTTSDKETNSTGLLSFLEEPKDFLTEMRKKLKENDK